MLFLLIKFINSVSLSNSLKSIDVSNSSQQSYIKTIPILIIFKSEL